MKDNQTILIVDDVKDNIDVLMALLKDFDLIPALDGRTAIDIVNSDEEVDLILLDIMMPEMDGFEVCEILKSSPKTKHIPIIFLSAKTKLEDIQRGFELGGVDYITKPFNPHELLSRTNTHLKLRAYEKNLENKITQEIEKNKLKEQMIYQQSKQAALGELLMHIAHQWKQPLSTLASVNILNKVALNDTTTDKEKLLENIDKSEELISFMSNTVDTFKNFYKPSNESKDFFIYESVIDVLYIVEATFYYENIKIFVENFETQESFANVNEFSQVLFSILSNAREIFKIRKIEHPEIHIEVYDKKLTISDNAGGIDEDIIDDIFSPFVSGSNGTGSGLYLAKNIVDKNNAVIYAENKNNGACFTVEFLTWID